jgi:uncharacterized protein
MSDRSRLPRQGFWDARRARLTSLVVLLAILPAAFASAAPKAADSLITVQDQDTPVIDQAKVLDPATEEKLIDLLHQLKLHTGAQIKVLTVGSLGDEDIFDFAQRHFRLWKLGQKGKDNGALVVLAPKEHKVRIHTGDGLEGVLPDIWCGSIERQAAKLYFARGDYSEGLLRIVQSMAQRISDDAKAPLAGLPTEPLPLPDQQGGDGTLVFVFFFLAFVIFIVVMGQIQRRQQQRWGNRQSGFGRNYFPYFPGGMGGSSGGSGGWTFGGGSGGWSSGGSDFGGGGSSVGGGAGASW